MILLFFHQPAVHCHGDHLPRDKFPALFELSTLVPEAEGKRYFDYAETLLMNLSSDAYLARKGANGGFILMHSVGHLPADSEIDTPLNYADYYYLEAIGRYLSLRRSEEHTV